MDSLLPTVKTAELSTISSYSCVGYSRSAGGYDRSTENKWSETYVALREHPVLKSSRHNCNYSAEVTNSRSTIEKCMTKVRAQNGLTSKSKLISGANSRPGIMPMISPTTYLDSSEHIRKLDTTTSIKSTQCTLRHQPLSDSSPHSHYQFQMKMPGTTAITSNMMQRHFNISARNYSSRNHNIIKAKKSNSVRCKMLVPLPMLGTTSFVTFLTIICIETVLLSTMSSCAKTFYMHWNTSNSIFRIDNTDHIIDVNKGNLAFEFDQVHIICPVYEPGAFENETEKYIIYNVSKVEYETCRITNADPRVIAICDKPQKLMFFTITFRPFTPQPGGLEFLPGNDYYFISTSSKDDLYRRIGGRCSTNNMKVVFKVCCAAEEKNKTLGPTVPAEHGAGTIENVDNAEVNVDLNLNMKTNHGHLHNAVNTIGISGVNTGIITAGGTTVGVSSNGGVDLKSSNGMGTSINTNIDQFNRIPIQPNILGNNIGPSGTGLDSSAGNGIILSPGNSGIKLLPPGRGGGVHMTYPGHHHIQTGIRINNVPTQQNIPHPRLKDNVNDEHHNYDKHPNEVVKNEELTYNSGSTRPSIYNQLKTYIWVWTWLPGSHSAISLVSSMCALCGINSSVLLAIVVVIIFHYLIAMKQGLRNFTLEAQAGVHELRRF